jgi:hydroxymethylpyrimidine/phosphomethylpyrimidine kinase
MTAITAITAQNTLGVKAVMPVPAEMLLEQLWATVTDLGCDAVKIGMIGSPEGAEAVIEFLEQTHRASIVFDPVMVATSGAALADAETIGRFRRLMSLSHLATPNLPELQALTGQSVDSEEERTEAARRLASETGCAVLAKGGHGADDTIVDLLIDRNGATTRWADRRIDTSHTHGTGCTLASAIATGLGEGRGMAEAVARSRTYVRAALEAAPGFGGGHGPMGHALGVVPFDLIHKKEK